MPLFKRKEHLLSPMPADLKPDDEVFVSRLTGEVFKVCVGSSWRFQGLS